MEHDNTNRGACWKRRAFGGNLNLGGTDYYCDLVEVASQGEKVPAYRAYIRLQNGSMVYDFPVWRDDKPESKRVAYGKVVTPLGEFWVSVFQNTPQGNKPILGLSAQVAAPQAPASAPQQQPAGPAAPTGEDIPF